MSDKAWPISYYRARYYDPQSGRFLSEDPIGFEGGVNFYTYVQNDSQDWVDWDGTQRDRSTTGRPDGTPNPFKKMTPDPDDPNKVIFRDPSTGKQTKKAKPPGFDDYWKKKHPQPQQKPKPTECPKPDSKPEPSKSVPQDRPVYVPWYPMLPDVPVPLFDPVVFPEMFPIPI